jgi:hypothetical protein
MILSRTQKAKSFFGNFEVTGADFDWAIVSRSGTLAALWAVRAIPKVVAVASVLRISAHLPLLRPIILPAILMRAVVMSAVLMMSCAHERVRTVWSQGYNRVTPKNEFRIGNAAG